MRSFINIVGKLIEGVRDSPQFIEDPNSSGQGHHPNHADHPFHDVLKAHQYSYSHTTPIRARDGGYDSHHTYRHLDMRDNVVGIYRNGWEAGKLGQRRRTHGKSPEALDRFLRGHVKRATKKLEDNDPRDGM